LQQELGSRLDEHPRGEPVAVLRERVERFAGLLQPGGPPLAVLLTELERLIPDGVELSSLVYSRRKQELGFVAEAQGSEGLTHFLERLEEADVFTRVLVTKKSRGRDSGRQQFEFRIGWGNV
jgi:hypothetical protein